MVFKVVYITAKTFLTATLINVIIYNQIKIESTIYMIYTYQNHIQDLPQIRNTEINWQVSEIFQHEFVYSINQVFALAHPSDQVYIMLAKVKGQTFNSMIEYA